MAGYWSSSFFANLWTETKSIKTKKKLRQISARLTEQVWSIKNLLYGQKWETQEIPSGQDGPFLPARVANQNTRFARGISHGYITQ